jgi:uncharacterized delta-60 repeat protein
VPDAGFGTAGTRVVDLGGTEQGFSIARQTDGKFVFGGLTSTGTDHLVVGWLNADGSPEPSFNGTGIRTLGSGFGDVGRDVAVQADGKILVLGFGGVDFKLTRLNPNGSVDTGFGSGGTATIDFGAGDIGQSLLLLGNGKIAFSGQTGGDRGAVALLQPGGTLDTTFSGDCKVTLPPSMPMPPGWAWSRTASWSWPAPPIVPVGTSAVLHMSNAKRMRRTRLISPASRATSPQDRAVPGGRPARVRAAARQRRAVAASGRRSSEQGAPSGSRERGATT